MADGQFHGQGTLYFPGTAAPACQCGAPSHARAAGLGRYVATWDNGRVVMGEYFFEDGLKWEEQQWRYLNKQKGERRYYTEQLSAIPPAGLSKRHDREPPPNVPIGKYDTGTTPTNLTKPSAPALPSFSMTKRNLTTRPRRRFFRPRHEQPVRAPPLT